MMYLSWAALYEGSSDQSYFDVLLPRIMEEITLAEGTRAVTIPATPTVYLGRQGRQIEKVAQEVCENSDAFHLLFIHADAGGRALEDDVDNRGAAYCQAVSELCEWNPARCVILKPRHETEAWVMADPKSVAEALGFSGRLDELGLPNNAAEAERLVDPKSTLENAAKYVQGRRSRRGVSQLFPKVAQNQSIVALRTAKSFRDFEESLRNSLASFGCLKPRHRD